jgi:hypothetical protein
MTNPSKAELEKEARKKREPNYLKIRFGYDSSFVLPYKDGIALLQAMEGAEVYDTSDYAHPVIRSISADNNYPETSIISREQYLLYKVAHLLKLNKSPEESK